VRRHSRERVLPFNEVDVPTDHVLCLVLAAVIAAPTAASAQQPSQPIVPGLPGAVDDRSGWGAGPSGPIPDTSHKTISTPDAKPMTPPQRPQLPPSTLR
jgi:hypothetical protein